MNQTAQCVSSPFDLKTRGEAARLLRVHVSTVDRLTARGNLRPVRIGRRVLYDPQELQRFTRSCQSA